MNESVVQDWVAQHCSWKEQTVLFCSLRGPDIGGSQDIKEWVRFIRRTTLKNADGSTSFMMPSDPPRIFDIGEKYPRVFDGMTLHTISHFMHGLQVIAYKHPDTHLSGVAEQAYKDLCEYLHVRPELLNDMVERLKDKRP